jgi:hypothetical protein
MASKKQAKREAKKATLAERNKKALETAKKAAEATESKETTAEEKKVEEPKATETKPVEKKAETPKATSKKEPNINKPISTLNFPTAYEKAFHLRNQRPDITIVSRSVFTDDHGIENVKEELKHPTSGETCVLVYPVNQVKPDDKSLTKEMIDDMRKIAAQKKERAEQKAKKEEAKKEDSKKAAEAKKPEPKKEPAKPKAKKIETVYPEEVKPEEVKKPTKEIDLIQGVETLAERTRIDENHQVRLLEMTYDRYIKNAEPDIPEDIRNAAKETFDHGLCQLLLIYSAQLQKEGKVILGGIEVKKDIFPLIRQSFLDLYGVTTKVLPSPTSPEQLTIKFENVPDEVKKAAKADAEAKTVFTIPEPNTGMPEEEKLSVVRGITKRQNVDAGRVANRVATNFIDAINWAKKAWDVKSNEPAATVAMLAEKLVNADADNLCIKVFKSKTAGSLRGNFNPFISHALIAQDLKSSGYTDFQIANIVKVLLSAELNSKKGDEQKKLTDEINSIITDSTKKEVVKQIVDNAVPYVSLTENANEKRVIDNQKLRKMLSIPYGDSEPIINAKIEELAGYYNKPIDKLANYKDESAYSKA